MVILRATKRLSSALPAGRTLPAYSDTALGDWYVNRLLVDRRPLLLLVSSASLPALLVPARDVRSLPDRLPALVDERLRRLGIGNRAIAAELQAMDPVLVGPTADRSVIGIMVDFARAVPYYLESGQWTDATLRLVEDRLAETPCHAGSSEDRVIFPERKAPDLLRAKWLANEPLPPRGGAPGVVH
jgi:hypothetical protein